MNESPPLLSPLPASTMTETTSTFSSTTAIAATTTTAASTANSSMTRLFIISANK
jgi:hypothetical protein